MPSLKFILYLMCLLIVKLDLKYCISAQKTNLLSPSYVHQVKGFVSANIGDNVTLQCFYVGDDSSWLFWYKQTLGQKPKLISSMYVYDTKITFHSEFKNNKRFKLNSTRTVQQYTNHLTVFNLDFSDSATYYCGNSYTFVLKFAEGTIVSVRAPDLNIQPTIHQSVSGTVHPGGSVTLNCTVNTGTCDGNHSVYWFKDSGESQPGIIYSNEDRNDQCERKTETQTHTCVYNLPLKRLNHTDAGIYYCAAISCGQIVFGNGTNIDIKYEVNITSSLVFYLSGALIVIIIVIVFLAFSLYKMIKRNHCQCRDLKARSASSTTNEEGSQHVDNLQYAALRVNMSNRSRKQRTATTTECVYSSLK